MLNKKYFYFLWTGILQVFPDHRKSTEPWKVLGKCTSDVYQPAGYNKKRVAWHKILECI